MINARTTAMIWRCWALSSANALSNVNIHAGPYAVNMTLFACGLWGLCGRVDEKRLDLCVIRAVEVIRRNDDRPYSHCSLDPHAQTTHKPETRYLHCSARAEMKNVTEMMYTLSNKKRPPFSFLNNSVEN